VGRWDCSGNTLPGSVGESVEAKVRLLEAVHVMIMHSKYSNYILNEIAFSMPHFWPSHCSHNMTTPQSMGY
jgi:hypothetical protein